MFNLALFWAGQKRELEVHYSLRMAEVALGCAKAASAKVEVVFSGAGRISTKSHCLDPQLLSDHAFLHYKYKYDWLRPTLQEIVDAYSLGNSMAKSRVCLTMSLLEQRVLR